MAVAGDQSSRGRSSWLGILARACRRAWGRDVMLYVGGVSGASSSSDQAVLLTYDIGGPTVTTSEDTAVTLHSLDVSAAGAGTNQIEVTLAVGDGTHIVRTCYGPGRDGSEVVLYLVEGGGHTWPGRPPLPLSLGKSTGNLDANDVIWDFFRRHER